MFYENTKKRISVSHGAEKEPPPVIDLPEEVTDYDSAKDYLVKFCDTLLNVEMTIEQQEKIIWLKTRLIIEL
jgi:hypothetical protein